MSVLIKDLMPEAQAEISQKAKELETVLGQVSGTNITGTITSLLFTTNQAFIDLLKTYDVSLDDDTYDHLQQDMFNASRRLQPTAASSRGFPAVRRVKRGDGKGTCVTDATLS